MTSPAPKRRLDTGRRRTVSTTRGRRRDTRPSFGPAFAVFGTLALLIAGWGATASPEPPEPGALPSDRRALSDTGGTGQDVSRDFDRELLEEQAQAQAEQLLQAQQDLLASSQVKADELKADQWVLPVTGYRISGQFGTSNAIWGNGHSGLDLAGPSGSTIVSVASGTVISAGYAGNCGNMTQIQLDTDDVVVKFCHQSRIVVQEGQRVQAGETVGYTGSTGRSTGPHLHMEVKPGDGPSGDPEAYFREHNVFP
ncbi:MAG: M23 family metallopeptidase [Aeromicrobium sp.]|uniref:M23 family metallopeptidase n=1 Tax=Aeromicrobium sp. TaxID=1871063 RepID=UPI002603E9D8|nr:M23 family metallopeptidase [Aeromicrobium sp.]MDF1704416.1 M23 family metallopeptidase [Aeromicrobium sp.]